MQLDINERKRIHRRRRAVIALLAFGGAIAIAWPDIGDAVLRSVDDVTQMDIPVGSYILAVIGVAALWFRR